MFATDGKQTVFLPHWSDSEGRTEIKRPRSTSSASLSPRGCLTTATVANAVPSILQMTDIVTRGTNGKGLVELIDESTTNDLSRITAAVHEVLLEIEELRFQRGIDRFFLLHHRPTPPAGSRLDKRQLLPVDADCT